MGKLFCPLPSLPHDELWAPSCSSPCHEVLLLPQACAALCPRSWDTPRQHQLWLCCSQKGSGSAQPSATLWAVPGKQAGSAQGLKPCLAIQDHATNCCSTWPEDEQNQISLWQQQRVQGQREGLQHGNGKPGFSSLPAGAEGTNKQTDELNCLLNLCISIHITEPASSNSSVLIINAT